MEIFIQIKKEIHFVSFNYVSFLITVLESHKSEYIIFLYANSSHN